MGKYQIDIYTVQISEFFCHIELILDIRKEAAVIDCINVQISQVILNFLNNSMDAISELTDKWIKLVVDEDYKGVTLKCIDSGNGIPDAIREKLFQPFFTTKAVGKGTGLGLSISQGIIKAHGAKLHLDEESKNTCFVISFPKQKAIHE